jgi:hypothetical protein
MSFWKKKKYCKFCGSEENADGSCSNSKCIAYKDKSTEAVNEATNTEKSDGGGNQE